MRFKNAAKILLFVAAIALISVKIAMAITPEAAFQPQFPAGYESLANAEATAQELHLHDDEPMAYAAQSGLATTSDCVPCNQAAAAEECPSGCECLTREEGTERGLSPCDGEWIECVVSASLVTAPVMGYCYQTAEEEECPDHCVCLPVADAEAEGYRLCDGVEIECALQTRVEHRCYHVKCPDGCVCVTPAVAKARGYPGPCDGVQTLCGYDAHGNPEYCYTETGGPVVCRDEDINLRQVRLESGDIRFIADMSCPIARVEMIIDGTSVRECEGPYCEFTGGPYPLRATPDFSAVLFDHLDEEVGTPTFTPEEIVVTMPDDVAIIDFDPCPLCPDPEPEWGECLSHTCDGNHHFQAYDWTSNVRLTGCIYEDYTLTGGLPIHLGEGLMVEMEVADPFFDYCLNADDIMLHRCRNNFISRYTHTCPYGCYGGACVCATSDGGIDLYERGGVLYGTEYYVPGAVDYCVDENTLREYYTEVDHENNTCTIKWIEFECPGVCTDGECRGTCFDGIRNEGEHGIDCGGPCLAACEYGIGWYPQNYGFKFENPAGQELSHGSCWSKSTSCSTGYGHYKGTFGNCSVCICNKLFRCCTGWHLHAASYYLVYRYGGAPAGQCTGMSLSSLAFYYGDRDVTEYDPWAEEVIHLDYEGDLKRHIASRQGKIVSGQNINHYLFASEYRGANNVLNKVEDALSNDPPDYGMIMVIEDNGWGGLGGTVRRGSLGHTVVATNVVHVNDETAKIYVYDSNYPVAESPEHDSPYFDIDRSPYIEIDKQKNHYTFYDDPDDPTTDSDGQLWSNANNEEFDRIIYVPYSKLGGDVDIPLLWDILIVGIISSLGSADAQVEDAQGGILGFSEDGPDAPAIEDAMILPIFGEPAPEFPTTFALPVGDYKLNIRGTASGNYSAIMLGPSPHAFTISGAGVSEGTRDTISLQYGDQGQATLSFSTSDTAKHYSLDIASLGEYEGDATETLYSIMNTRIFSGSEALFSVDPVSHSLIYTNYGDKAVTYSMQIYRAAISPEGITQETVQPMAAYQAEADQDCAGGCTGALTAPGYGADDGQAMGNSDAEGDLAAVLDDIQITGVYTFTIEPMEKHTISPEDWSDLPASEIHVIRESVATSNWPLIGGIIGGLVIVAIVVAILVSRRRGSAPQTGR
ncbi:MAG: hypothetical protein R6V59_08935 [Dehalococcoidia bacterium]